MVVNAEREKLNGQNPGSGFGEADFYSEKTVLQ